MTETMEQVRTRKAADETIDIYTEDGSIRPDFLALVGAAIADRDILFLRNDVARLHESELGDLIAALMPEQRVAMINLLGDEFDMTCLLYTSPSPRD